MLNDKIKKKKLKKEEKNSELTYQSRDLMNHKIMINKSKIILKK
jgi:hypothetical protein